MSVILDEETAIQEIEDRNDGISWKSSLFNLTNTSIGAGTLTLPFIMHQCGLILGVFIILIIGILSWFSLYFLTVCSNISGKSSFIGIAREAYGKQGERYTSLILFLLLIGPLSAYFKIIADNFNSVIRSTHFLDENAWYTKDEVIMAVFGLCLMFPLCFVSLKHLSYASLLSLLAMVYCIVLIPISYIEDLCSEAWLPPKVHLINPSWSILSGFATLGMAFINHPIVIECTTELRNPTSFRQHSLTTVSSMITCVLYCIVSICGYLHHGDKISENILNSEDQSVPFQISRILVAIGVALTYPLLMAPALSCINAFISNSDEEIPLWRKTILRLLIFLISFSFVVLVPSLEKIFAFFGALTGSLIVYVLPVVFYIEIGSKYKLVQRIGWRLSLNSQKSARENDDDEIEPLMSKEQDSPLYEMHPGVVRVFLFVNLFIGLFLFFCGTGYCIYDMVTHP